VDDLRGGTELLDVAGHAIVETRADGDEHVAMVHRHIGFIGAMHAEHAEELPIGRRIGAKSHQRIGDGIAEHAGKLGQRFRTVAENDAAARIDHRTLGRSHQSGRAADLAGVALDHRIVRTQADFLRIDVIRTLRGDILGNVDQHRTGASRRGDVEGLLQGDRQVLDVLHQEVVLHAGTGYADGIDFLKRIVADQTGRHLAGEHDQRNGIHVCGRDAGDHIGRTRTGGDQHDAGLAGRTCVTVGRMSRTLLVTDQNVFYVVLLVQGVIDVQDRATRIAEDVLDALVLQEAHHYFRTRQFHNGIPREIIMKPWRRRESRGEKCSL
jgi:hypothetical protein